MEKAKAGDVAKRAVAEKLTAEQVSKLIPSYGAPLPRRAWLQKFNAALPDGERARFAELK